MDGLPGSHPTGAGGSPPDVEIAMVGAATSVADLVSTWVEHTAHEMATGSAMGPDPANGLPGGAFAAAGRGKSGKAAAKKQSVVAQRRWLMIDTEGDTRMTSLNKYDLTQDLGIQLRDLRCDERFIFMPASSRPCLKGQISHISSPQTLRPAGCSTPSWRPAIPPPFCAASGPWWSTWNISK